MTNDLQEITTAHCCCSVYFKVEPHDAKSSLHVFKQNVYVQVVIMGQQEFRN